MEKKAAISKDAIKASIAGLVAAGGMDYIIHDGDYSELTKGRVANSILNGIIGTGAALHGIKNKDVPGALGMVGAMIGKDLALTTLPLVSRANETLRGYNEPSISKYLPAIATGLSAAAVLPAIPALINISRAADRVGDGRSIRTSTIIRRRPGETSDMTIGLASADGEEEKNPEEVEKTWWQKIFG